MREKEGKARDGREEENERGEGEGWLTQREKE